MTRENREEIINSMSLKDAIQVFRDTNAYGTMDIAKTVILKALEQEPILDKIKRDIFKACSDNYHMPVYKLDCDEIFEIIDKYREESEA